MLDFFIVKRKLVLLIFCGVSAVGLRVIILILGCFAYFCGFGVCCISLRVFEIFFRIVVMRFIFFFVWDIFVLVEGLMVVKNYIKNKEYRVFILIYLYYLYLVFIFFFNYCCNSEVSMWIYFFLRFYFLCSFWWLLIF